MLYTQCPPYHRLLSLIRIHAKISLLFKTSPSDSRSPQRSSYKALGTYKPVFLLFLLLPPPQGASNHPAAGNFSANAPSLMGIWHLPRAWYVQFLPFMHQTQNQCSGLGSGGIGTMGATLLSNYPYLSCSPSWSQHKISFLFFSQPSTHKHTNKPKPLAYQLT